MAADNIYTFIEAIRQRPGMFTPDKSLHEINSFLFGYVKCLSSNNIEEDVDGRPFTPADFSIWLYETFGWSGACGFAYAITEHTRDTDEAFDRFFELVAQYRADT